MPREPREQLVVDLLTNDWNASNTHGLTPSVIYAEPDESPDTAYVAVEQYSEGPIGGGETGFDGIDPTGGSPHQTISGSVPVHLYADDTELSGASTGSAKVYLTGSGSTGGAVDEVQRIIRANAVSPTNPSTSNTPVDIISPTTFNRVPEPDEPTTAHYAGEVLYLYSTA